MATQPVSPERINRLLASSDARLNKLEAKAIRALVIGLLASQNALLAQLRPEYALALTATQLAGRAIKEARARRLIEQVRHLLNLIPATSEPALRDLIEGSATLGVESARTLITLHDPALATAFSQLPREALLAAATNSHARLLAHGEEAAARMSAAIVQGISNGSSYRKVAAQIVAQTGITRRQAETIVRTESIAAHTTAHLETYRASNVRWVTWNATLDAHVCEWCASRAGSSWEVGQAPEPPAHPNCRCRLTPDAPEWHQAGLVDEAWAREHHAGAMQAAGIDRRKTGPTDFEQRAGITFASPVWTP